MGPPLSLQEAGADPHAEPLLLVDHGESEPLKGNALPGQGVGAHEQVDPAGAHPLQQAVPLGPAQGSGKEPDPEPEGTGQGGEGPGMLLGQ